MKRLVAFATFLYGEQMRRDVFEPLIADLQRELAEHPSVALRVRWTVAIASTFVISLPRAAFAGVATLFVLDLAWHALAFGIVAAVLQVSFARSWHGPATMPLSFASIAPFMLMPVVWRIRISDLLTHQQRLLAAGVVSVAAAAAALGADTWSTRMALASMPVIASTAGWRLGNPTFYASPEFNGRRWTLIAMIASILQLCTWPAGLAMGLEFNQFWPHGLLMTYVFGGILYVSIGLGRRQGVPATRR